MSVKVLLVDGEGRRHLKEQHEDWSGVLLCVLGQNMEDVLTSVCEGGGGVSMCYYSLSKACTTMVGLKDNY